MSRKLFILVCVVFLVLSSASLVSADYGPYVGVRGDVSFLNDSDVSAPQRPGYPSALDLTAATKTGYAVRGAVGYAFQNSFRLEAEIGYRNNGLTGIDIRSPGTLVDISAEGVAATVNQRAGYLVYADPSMVDYKDLLTDGHKALAHEGAKGKKDISGKAEALTLLVNGYYDFHLESGLKPYVGAGMGVAFLSADAEGFGRKLTDDSDAVFAYQAFAGVGYEVNVGGQPVTFLLDYSYFASQNPTITGKTTGTEFEFEFNGHYLGLGALFFFEGL